MKFIKMVPEEIEVDVIEDQHAVYGQIVTTKDLFDPCFVLHSYFESKYIKKYGYSSPELLKHDTGYINCLNTNGTVIRLQYYEYVIIKDDKELIDKFTKKFKGIDSDGFTVGERLPIIDNSVVI